MPVQKTFTIVPAVSRDASPGPAFVGGRMTSKQVKEAYKTAGRGPRMSRAERIQMERAEQQRIRKEMEKEKAAAKAKLLRDKKKEKELAEREVKRREGKPLVKVRPSQDTISRFVRGNGSSRKRDCAGSVIEQPQAVLPQAELSASQTNRVCETKSTLVAIMGRDDAKLGIINSLNSPCVSDIDNNEVVSGIHPQEERDGTNTDVILDGDLPSDVLHDLSPSTSDHPVNEEKERNQHSLVDEALAAVLDGDLDTDLSQDAHSKPDMPQLLPEEQKKTHTNSDQLHLLLDDDLALDDIDEMEGVDDTKKGPASMTLVHVHAPNLAGINGDSPHGSVSAADHVHQKTPEGRRRPTLADEVSQKSQNLDPTKHTHDLHSVQISPLATQTIMQNLDDFFPTASQQARELDQEKNEFDLLLDSLTQSQAMPPPPAPLSATMPAQASSPLSSVTPRARRFVAQQQHSGERHGSCTMPSSSLSPKPQRWFTASGSKERESLMIQRSRRTAALEGIQQKERKRATGWAGPVEERMACTSNAICGALAQGQEQFENLPFYSSPVGKENIAPEPSQETDYGGGWMEDFEF